VEGRGVKTLIEGKPAVLVAIRDITERKMLEGELNASAERYKQLAECSLDALVITDLLGNIVITNQAALTLLEVEDQKELQGCPVFRFVAPESREDALRDFAGMELKQEAIMRTYAGITTHGNRIIAEVLGNRITYKGANATIISIRDISKRTINEKYVK
ncbi:MAG: PAS domain S-box protein, partial [Methanoregula sp.]